MKTKNPVPQDVELDRETGYFIARVRVQGYKYRVRINGDVPTHLITDDPTACRRLINFHVDAALQNFLRRHGHEGVRT